MDAIRFINVMSGRSRPVQSAAHGSALMKTYGAHADRFYGSGADSVTSGRRFPTFASIIPDGYPHGIAFFYRQLF